MRASGAAARPAPRSSATGRWPPDSEPEHCKAAAGHAAGGRGSGTYVGLPLKRHAQEEARGETQRARTRLWAPQLAKAARGRWGERGRERRTKAHWPSAIIKWPRNSRVPKRTSLLDTRRRDNTGGGSTVLRAHIAGAIRLGPGIMAPPGTSRHPGHVKTLRRRNTTF